MNMNIYMCVCVYIYIYIYIKIPLFKSLIALEFFFIIFIEFIPVYFTICLASGNSIFLKYRQNVYYSYLLFLHVNYPGFL